MSGALCGILRVASPFIEGMKRLSFHAALSACLASRLPASNIVLGRVSVYGTRRIRFGEDVLLYPGVHLETHGDAWIDIGDGVVISSGAHIVAMSGIVIGRGSMIGEYTSIRDANHKRMPGQAIRDSGYTSKPIHIGHEVWLGRGVAVLSGVAIGDAATIGANAVVTKDIPAGSTAVGIPAKPTAVPSARVTQERQAR